MVSSLKAKVRSFVSSKFERLLANEKSAERVAKAIGAIQKGRERAQGVQEKALHMVGLPTRAEMESLRGKVSSLGRRMSRLEEEIEEAVETVAQPAPDLVAASDEPDEPTTLQ